MAEAQDTFAYVAIGRDGGRVKGVLVAGSQAAAFDQLKRGGMSPVSLRAKVQPAGGGRLSVGDRRLAETLSSLGLLLSAGADIRSALSMLASRSASRKTGALCRRLLEEVSGGQKVDVVLASTLKGGQGFIAALVSAAEASGDLGAGFSRAGEVLSARCKLRDQLVSTLSYPAFVLVSTVAAVLAILLFVVPTLAPLVEEAGGSAPPTLKVLLWASNALSANLTALIVGAALAGGLIALLWRLRLLAEPLDRLLLDGPARGVRRGLIFGSFSIVLGSMLSAGAPLGDALRLAVRTAPSRLAASRLEAAAAKVRQGQLLSAGLDGVQGFPDAIVRMCAVGESSGSLGLMLSKAGRLEEEEAFRRIETVGRLLGPVLIVILGGLVGTLMAALLSGLSQVGQGLGQ